MVDIRRDSPYLFEDKPSSLPQRILADARTSLVSAVAQVPVTASGAWQRRNEIAQAKLEGFKAMLTFATAVRVTPYVLLFLLAFLPAAILANNFEGVFNSPDETARYLSAQTFAETGQIYIEDDITLANPEFATGPRLFAQHNGRSVPTYSQMPLLLFGIMSALFGGAAPFLLAFIPGALFVALALLVRRLLPTSSAYVPWVFLGVTPLWYWSSRAYFDVAITFLLIAVGLLFFVRAIQSKSERDLFIGGLLFGLAALARIPEAPFLFLLGFAFVLAIGHLIKANRTGYLKLTSMYGVALFASFFIPMLILNWWTNGSATTVSYTLLFEQNFPDRVQPATNVFLEPFRLIWLALFPQPLNYSTLYSTFIYQVLLMNPFLLFLGLIGIVQYGGVVARNFGGYGAAMLGIAFVYMLISRNDPGTFLAGQSEPDLRVTLVRYWMPVFMLLGLGAALAFAKMPHRFALPLVAAFVISSAYTVWYTGPEAVSNLERTLTVNAERFEQFYNENTEADALVVAGSSFDKWTTPHRRTIGIWPDTATDENLRHLADTGASAVKRGQPVYFMFGPNEPEDAATIISTRLEPEYLGLTLVAEPDFAGSLWKITSNPQALSLQETEIEPPFGSGGFGAPGEPPIDGESAPLNYTSEFEAPGKVFTVTVENDGSSTNLIENPSFEINADLWRGPVEQGPVEVTTEYAAFGQSALRMELSPAADAGVRVRRTYSLPLDDLSTGSWDLRAHVNVTDLSVAAVEMLVFVQDSAGNNLIKPLTRLERETAGFEALVVRGGKMPAEAAQLAVQISIVSTAAGGAGVAFWDGIELVDSVALPYDYCDGDHFGCSWEGAPHASASSRAGGIQATAIGTGDSEIEVDHILVAGDQIIFRDGVIELQDANGGSEWVGIYGSITAGDMVRLTLTADSRPAVTVIGP